MILSLSKFTKIFKANSKFFCNFERQLRKPYTQKIGNLLFLMQITSTFNGISQKVTLLILKISRNQGLKLQKSFKFNLKSFVNMAPLTLVIVRHQFHSSNVHSCHHSSHVARDILCYTHCPENMAIEKTLLPLMSQFD